MSKKTSNNKRKEKRVSILAIVSFIISLFSWFPLISIVAIILSIIALVRISKNQELNGSGWAIAGLIIGIIFTILYIILLIFIFNLIGSVNTVLDASLSEGLESCRAQAGGFNKDMCIVTLVSLHYNETIDRSICDEATFKDVGNICNAIVTKDSSYCGKIEDSNSRLKCLGLVDEIKSKVDTG